MLMRLTHFFFATYAYCQIMQDNIGRARVLEVASFFAALFVSPSSYPIFEWYHKTR